MIAQHLTYPGKVYPCASFDEACDLVRAMGGYIVSTHGDVVTWDDFPRKNSLTRPIEIPPLPLHLLLNRA